MTVTLVSGGVSDPNVKNVTLFFNEGFPNAIFSNWNLDFVKSKKS